MTKTRIYEAGEPRVGDWVLQWQTAYMPAPAFWYFPTQAEAAACLARMQSRTMTVCV